MDFGEVALLVQEFIARKQAESGEDDKLDDCLIRLLELLETIRNEKRQGDPTSAAEVQTPQAAGG